MKKFTSLALTIGLLTLIFSSVSAKEHPLKSLGDGDYALGIVYTGGVSGTVLPYKGNGGLPTVRLIRDSLEAQMKESAPDTSAVLFLDVGDGLWGSGEALVTNGYAPVRMYNAVRYDAILLGNLDVANPALDALEEYIQIRRVLDPEKFQP